MTLTELISLQREFDKQHKGKFDWDCEITQEDLNILGFLVLALSGEVGEIANIVKKIVRGDYTLEEKKEDIKEEIIDTLIYLMKLSYQFNIDIENEYLKKMEKNKMRFKEYEKK